jgi:hypothetical protein
MREYRASMVNLKGLLKKFRRMVIATPALAGLLAMTQKGFFNTP